MKVFVDESGDTGLGNDPSTSPFFVVTAVVFKCPLEAQRCSKKIQELKREFRMTPDSEFKFSRLRPKQKVRFFETVLPFDFTYHSVILDKKKLDGDGFKYHKSFYKFPIRVLFENAKRFLEEASVCVDKTGNEEFSLELEKYLQRRINSRSSTAHIKELNMEESHEDNLLQLADMFCGMSARTLSTDKKDHRLYRPIVIQKEAGFLKWPRRRRRRPKKK